MTFKILSEGIDKLGTATVIKHSKHVSFTPAYTFFIREVADLIDNKNSLPYTYWEDKDCAIIWAEQDEKVVGILVYDFSYVTYPMPHLSIILTAVDKNYRQRGIHQLMNEQYEEQARLLNCVAIRATVNLNNEVRFKTAEKDKLSPVLYIMSKRLK
jgi:GNAT superfamily N-acetyltransferase